MRSIHTYVVALVALLASTAPARATGSATITLDRSPQVPSCARAGEGTVSASWSIANETTPVEVVFRIETRARSEILYTETFPGDTGIDAIATWTPPAGTDGDFWVRVIYRSLEQGDESVAELPVYVCEAQSTICLVKRDDVDCSGDIGPGDALVPDYAFLCLETLHGDTVCGRTDAEGRVCWSEVPTGTHVASEVVAEGWQPVGARDVLLSPAPGGKAQAEFLNQRAKLCASPIERSSWGDVKAQYR